MEPRVSLELAIGEMCVQKGAANSVCPCGGSRGGSSSAALALQSHGWWLKAELLCLEQR